MQNEPIFHLPDHAKVWIYQSSRQFTTAETAEIQQLISRFVSDWASHGRELSAEGALLHQQFLVLAVDENAAGASGCSIDKSVAFVRHLQTEYGVNLFDRLTFAFRTPESDIAFAERETFAALYQSKKINDETIVFNNLVATIGDLKQKWEVKLAESWHKRMV